MIDIPVKVCFRASNSVTDPTRLAYLVAFARLPNDESFERIRLRYSKSVGQFLYDMRVLKESGLIEDTKERKRFSVTNNGKIVLRALGIKPENMNYGTSLRSLRESVKHSVPADSIDRFEERAYGDRANWISVLGAFDTWPYMEYVCRELAKANMTAFTSRYVYRTIDGEVVVHPREPNPEVPMGHFLRKLVRDAAGCIVIYSVSAGHYIETDWCSDEKKRTLGMAFVRTSYGHDSCSKLEPAHNGSYSVCSSASPAWYCVGVTRYCPFQKQGISLNVIEYYLGSKTMTLTAIDNFVDVPILLQDWLQRKF